MTGPLKMKRAAPARATRDTAAHAPKSTPRRRAGEWAVVTTKASGAKVVFGIYVDEASANRVVSQLAAVGCTSRVERACAGDVPGLQRRGAGIGR